jgi:hypothetical protein
MLNIICQNDTMNNYGVGGVRELKEMGSISE